MNIFEAYKVSSKQTWQSLLLAVASSQVLFLFSTPIAVAAPSSIRIAGQPAFTVTGANAETIQQNLDNALVAAKDKSPTSVNIIYSKGLPVITLGGFLVVTIDDVMAKSYKLTPAQLAQKWASGIRQGLTNQNSVQEYVAQLSGEFSQSTPAVHKFPRARSEQQNNDYQNGYQASNSGGSGADGYQNGNNQSPNYQNNNAQDDGYRNGNTAYRNSGRQNYGEYGSRNGPGGNGGYGGGQQYRGRLAYAPKGLVINVTLNTSLSTAVARSGDLIQATISQPVALGDMQIPAGSIVEGTVTDASQGKMMARSGSLGFKFNRLRTPDGQVTPITAHLTGSVDKYSEQGGDQSDIYRGETWKNKVGSGLFRGAIGAGSGAALGTAVGAIAGGGHGAGMGAWSGTAIGGTVGVADSLLLRKGNDVNLKSGMRLQLELDSPVSIAGSQPAGGQY